MASTIDFRFLDEGLGGQKNKRKRSNDEETRTHEGDNPKSMDLDTKELPPPPKRHALPSIENPEKPVFERSTYDGTIAGKVSGRKWKQVRQVRASAVMVSRKGTSFELRAKQKEIKKAYKERMTELKEEIRLNKVEKRKKREREKKKKENILRSGTKLQTISNPKTLKKIAKSKQRKLLKVVPDKAVKK